MWEENMLKLNLQFFFSNGIYSFFVVSSTEIHMNSTIQYWEDERVEVR